jgi:hypothetical protein
LTAAVAETIQLGLKASAAPYAAASNR